MESQFHELVVFYIMMDTRVYFDWAKTYNCHVCAENYQQQKCVQDHVHTREIYPGKCGNGKNLSVFVCCVQM